MSVGNVLRETALANISESPTDVVAARRTRRVLLEANNAVPKGYGVCYDRTTGTATEDDPLRGYLVSLPTTTNHMSFAGIAVKDYATSTKRQWIELWEPGAVCPCFGVGAITIGEVMSCIVSGETASNGNFKTGFQGLPGRGTIRALQTASSGGLFLGELILGPESGLFHWLPVEILGATPAFTMTTHGITTIELSPGGSLGEDATNTLADGYFHGQQKWIRTYQTHISYDVIVTVTNGVQMDGTTALATMTFNGADWVHLEWQINHWKLLAHSGVVLA